MYPQSQSELSAKPGDYGVPDPSNVHRPPHAYGQPQPPMQPQVVYNVSRPQEPGCCCGVTAKVCILILYLISSVGAIMSVKLFFDTIDPSALKKAGVAISFLSLAVTIPGAYFVMAEHGPGILYCSLAALGIEVLSAIMAGVMKAQEKNHIWKTSLLVNTILENATLYSVLICVVFRLIVCERSYKLYRHIRETRKFGKVTGTFAAY